MNANLRHSLIVGASSTLGKATAARLDENKEELWLTYRSPEKRELLQTSFPTATLSQLEVTDAEALAALRSQITTAWNRLDSLVISVGKGILMPISATSARSLEDLLQVNLTSVIHLLKAFFPLLCKGRSPSIVLFSSITALAGFAGMSCYGATKAALASLTRSLAIEWASRGIRVNAVAPGIVPSPMVSGMFAPLTSEQIAAAAARHPLGFGEPADVAHAVNFLLSPASKWITGVILPVDGGYTAQ